MAAAATRDLGAGAVLVAIGAFFAWFGRGLPMTDSGAMGAGYFPRLLAFCLMGLGAALLLVPAAARLRQAHPPIPWRAVVLLTVALGWFALSVRPLGLGVALAGAVLLACAASPQSRPKESALLAAGVVLFAWLVFVSFLKVPLPMLGSWLR